MLHTTAAYVTKYWARIYLSASDAVRCLEVNGPLMLMDRLIKEPFHNSKDSVKTSKRGEILLSYNHNPFPDSAHFEICHCKGAKPARYYDITQSTNRQGRSRHHTSRERPSRAQKVQLTRERKERLITRSRERRQPCALNLCLCSTLFAS